MRYLKLFEAFESETISKVMKFVNSKIGRNDKSRFRRSLVEVLKSFNIPIDKIKESNKKYRDENKEFNKKYQKEYGKIKYNCECGSNIRKADLSKHLKTLKHKDFSSKNQHFSGNALLINKT